MDVHRVDLNLLVVFDMLMRQGSVTRAAEALGRSQPAASAALSRLRALFDDPLFVKVGAVMQPTPFAAHLAPVVRQVIDLVQHEVLQPRRFDAGSSDRQFTLLMPDIGEANFLPPILARLSKEAPAVRLRTRSIPAHLAANALEQGEVDLALGYFPDLHRDALFRQRLLRTEHVCVVRKDHPKIGRTLALRQYLDSRHVVVRPEGRTHVFEQFLLAGGMSRAVALEVSHFTSLEAAIATTDLVATVPRELAESWTLHGRVRMLPVPMKVPAIEVHQFWHRRMQKDAALAWLRALIFDLFRGKRPTGRVLPKASRNAGERG
jgi:DNA-binding transcriptional LysR family regulator